MTKPYVELSASEYRIHPQPTLPHVEGYRPHSDIEKSKKFPKCCDFHAEAIEKLEKWFEDDFPNFSKEEENAYKLWFKKSDFKGLPLKIVTQLSYTEYFIDKKISSPNWYDDIRHYIDYNILCFGNPALGFRHYLYLVKYYFQKIEKEIADEKRNKLIAYLDNKLNPQIKEVEVKDKTDINIIYATIQKWLNIFPFGLEAFSQFKKQYERKWLIISGTDDYNPYTGRHRIKTITKSELINLLITTSRELVKQTNSEDFVKNCSSTQEFNKYTLDILIERHSFKLQKLVTDFSTEEHTYINILEKWFDIEKMFLDGISELIDSGKTVLPNTPQSKYLKTFKTSFSRIQLERLRLHLIGNSYVLDISNDEFIYLFQNKPIVPSMKKLECLMPNTWCHYLLKEMVFKGINFNMKQVNRCIIGKDGKELNSNSGRDGYTEIDKFLKEIME